MVPFVIDFPRRGAFVGEAFLVGAAFFVLERAFGLRDCEIRRGLAINASCFMDVVAVGFLTERVLRRRVLDGE